MVGIKQQLFYVQNALFLGTVSFFNDRLMEGKMTYLHELSLAQTNDHKELQPNMQYFFACI